MRRARPSPPPLSTLHRPWIAHWCTQAASPSAELQAAMREDETLQTWRPKVDESLDGFYWDDGLLMKTITTNLEEQRELLIMPREFRPHLLKTAHDCQRHLCVKKVKATLLRRVLWPMLHQDVQWCLSCDTCQHNRKN